MSKYSDRTPKVNRSEATPSIATTAGGMTIRCSGKLTCDCGTRLNHLFYEALGDGFRLICTGCHTDLLSVTP